ncbi:MAG: hypothetical protein AB7O65_00800 [Candidatus Korobacteraceae bacterium]
MKRAGITPAIAKAGLLLFAVITGGLLAMLIKDIHEDRAYRVVITGAVIVYAEPEIPDESNPNQVVTVLGPRDEAEVLRISREDGWVRVRLTDHREGYIFLDAKIELRRR